MTHTTENKSGTTKVQPGSESAVGADPKKCDFLGKLKKAV